ncbi:DUF21 domain-containing protein [Senna tora]|uniref:DUF21 domain-containing protein n=1 Tax=Senna tora TaxID=362788 RepID=A0A834T0K9_9FABA|nr:DUF21 domain-containing protein [Senna tora]
MQAGKGGELSHHETCIISGAIDLTQKTAKDSMTPLSQIFSLDINSKLDMHTMTLITSKGHSRIPLYSGNPTNIIGLILVKNLIFCRPEDATPIKNLIIRKIPRVYENWPLYEILNQFQKGHSHMAVVLKENTAPQATTSTPEFTTSFELEEIQSNSIYKSTLSSSDVEFHSVDSDLHQQSRESLEKENRYVSREEIESLSTVLNEEVIGIITMEDVMEELLQGDILDETDEYVHVQKK